MLSVFIDTILICTATAMMCLSSGIVPSPELSGAPFVQTALATKFGAFGPVFITVSLLLFAFTTLIGNLYYCEGCMNYIAKRPVGKTGMNIFRVVACLVVFVGAMLEFGFVWNLADVLMGIMAIINLPVIVLLSKPALACLNDYIAQKKAGKNPVFKAADIGIKDELDFWK
jgi:AGCS family alanine or glycine:cation symporter